MGSNNAEIVRAIQHYQDRLDRYVESRSNDKILYVINKLKNLPIRTVHLEETGVGRTVNALKKCGGQVGEAAKMMVADWKLMVLQEEQAAEEAEGAVEEEVDSAVESAPDSSYSSEHEIYPEEHLEEQSHEREDFPEISDDYRQNETNRINENDIENDYNSRDFSYEQKGNKDTSKIDRKRDYDITNENKSERNRRKSDDAEYSDVERRKYTKEESKKKRKDSIDNDEKRGSKHEKSHSKRKRDSSDSESEYESKQKSKKSHNKREGSLDLENSHKKHKPKSSKEDKDLESDNSHKKYKSKSKDKESADLESGHKKHKSKSNREDKDSSDSENNYKKHKSKSSREDKEAWKSSREDKESSDSENSHKKHKSKSSREERDSSKSSKEDKESSKSKSKEKTASSSSSSSKHNRDKSEKSEKHEETKSNSERRSDKKDNSKPKHESKSSKHDSESRKSNSHSSDKKDKHKKEETKESKKSEEKTKSESTKKEKSSSSSKKSEKEKTTSSSSTSKPKSSHNSHTDESEAKPKVVKEKVTSKPRKIVHGIDSESGASFAEALGMCGPMPVINKAGSSKKKSASTTLPEKPESPHKRKLDSSISDDDDESTVEKYVPEALKEANLEPLNLNIDNLLPEISPNYRPLGFPIDNQPKRIMTDDEALSRVMSNRNQKTKVYSGNKTKGKVETLFELCVRILQDNIDALEYTGGVPYSILKAILEKATPDQLFNMEHHNPYLIEDTDELWQLHCQKEFRTKKREELESWREMYMRCLDEREARLTAITANIKQSQDKSLPIRTTKLAYVDSVAKPPRNIARKQFKNGISNQQKPTTASKLSALATAGEAGKVSVPNPGSRAVERSSHSGSSAAMKPKKAPLMAKTLSFLKNRFRR